MNKVYKVIWSKTRNCYVAVAEFVKCNGKGASSLNRRHIAAALAAVAICAAPTGALANSGGHWDGDNYIGDAPYKVTINEQVNGIAYGRYETGAGGSSGAILSIVTDGKANAAFGGRASSGRRLKFIQHVIRRFRGCRECGEEYRGDFRRHGERLGSWRVFL